MAVGIDRHELEHRNWRSAITKPVERDADVPSTDVTIVPDDIEAFAPKKPRKSGSKVKTDA